jgi:hypothetical protein
MIRKEVINLSVGLSYNKIPNIHIKTNGEKFFFNLIIAFLQSTQDT